jgi:hypothetical protein
MTLASVIPFSFHHQFTLPALTLSLILTVPQWIFYAPLVIAASAIKGPQHTSA